MYRLLPILCLILTGGLFACQAADNEYLLQAQLVWGTDQDKPKKPELKEVSAGLGDKLRKVFKWKNYFEVRRQSVILPRQSGERIRMSSKCELEFSRGSDGCLEVKLFGEGKLVVRKRQVLIPGEPMVLAGDDKNDTAWLVVITAPKK